ncbi:hypothetical protein [Paraburkholderia caffeinilytica]
MFTNMKQQRSASEFNKMIALINGSPTMTQEVLDYQKAIPTGPL